MNSQNIQLSDKQNHFRLKGGWGIILILFALSIIVKIIWVWNSPGPWLFFDEHNYKQASYNLFSTGKYFIDGSVFTQYPPLYPISILPSFLFKEHWYRAILIINSIINSISILIIYSISKKYFSIPLSILCAFLTALLPYNLVFTRMVMSENLLIPLFLYVFKLFIVDEPRKSKKTLIFMGIMLGICFLTRYIFLFMLPVLVATNIISDLLKKDYLNKSTIKEILEKILYWILGFLIILIPWFIYCVSNGSNLLAPLGGNIHGVTSNQQETVLDKGTIIWFLANALLLILSSAPYLSTLFSLTYTGGKIEKELKPIISVFSMVGLLLITVSITSNNYFKLTGQNPFFEERYWLPILVLLPFISISTMDYLGKHPINFWQGCVAFLLSAFAISLSYFLLISKSMWSDSPYINIHCTFSAGFNFENFFKIGNLRLLLPLVILINTAPIIKNQRLRIIIYTPLIVAFYLLSNIYDARALPEYYQNSAIHSAQIYSVIKENQATGHIGIIIDDDIYGYERAINWGTKFWGYNDIHIIRASEYQLGQGNQVCYWLSLKQKDTDVRSYTVNGTKYYLSDCAPNYP